MRKLQFLLSSWNRKTFYSHSQSFQNNSIPILQNINKKSRDRWSRNDSTTLSNVEGHSNYSHFTKFHILKNLVYLGCAYAQKNNDTWIIIVASRITQVTQQVSYLNVDY